MSAILSSSLLFFFFNDTSTTEIYTLSLHDALPIFAARGEVALHQLGSVLRQRSAVIAGPRPVAVRGLADNVDRKSTRLNSSHTVISYAVFCLKKKNAHIIVPRIAELMRQLRGT